MTFDSNIHHRKSIRLRSYDYAQPGLYYLTVCSYQKQHIFGAIVDGQMVLNRLGRIVQICWMAIPQHFSTGLLDEYVVMPNHLHGIIVVSQNDAAIEEGRNILRPYEEAHGRSDKGYRQARSWQAVPTGSRGFTSAHRGSIGAIVRIFKAAATREARRESDDDSIVLWQRNYYEHIIRGESQMNAARDYIRKNPANWTSDRENVK